MPYGATAVRTGSAIGSKLLLDEAPEVKSAIFSLRNLRRSNHCSNWEFAVDMGEFDASIVEAFDSDLRVDSRRLDDQEHNVSTAPINQTSDRLHLVSKGAVNEPTSACDFPSVDRPYGPLSTASRHSCSSAR
jgi:hypothetical protein